MLYWIQVGAFVLSVPLIMMTGYLLLLTMAALRGSHVTPVARHPSTRFLVAIPAHNEEKLLPNLLASLATVDYPRDLVDVHVVADNCRDHTAAVARAAGATVHERTDRMHSGKGPALHWLLQRLWQAGFPHDAVVFVDADTVVSRSFLRVMAAHFECGAQAVQGFYTVSNVGQSAPASLRYVALAGLHYLRPLGRKTLGLSAGLKGNGMVLAAALLRQQTWTAALTEDIEMHMALLLAGKTVAFAPDAVALAEMPNSLAATEAQLNRWEGGRLQMARRYVPRLLLEAWSLLRLGQWRRSLVLLDAVLEHLIPPFALLAAVTAVLLACALAGAGFGGEPTTLSLARLNLGLGLALLAGQAGYVFTSLRLVRAPRAVYLHLVSAPAYIAWKLRQIMRAWLARGRTGWQRTRRNEADSESADRTVPSGRPTHPERAGAPTTPPAAAPALDSRAQRMVDMLARGHYASPRALHWLRLHLVIWVLRTKLGSGLKRALDLGLGLALLLLSVPLMLLAAAAIRLDSPGPVFFRQKRVGKWGRLFDCYKFRSMYVDAEERKAQLAGLNEADAIVFKMKRDPRVTRVGHVLRKLSIDELPQLLNVIKGDMSLVGPRPPVPLEVDQYTYQHRQRLDAVPGITGLQQVSGRSDLQFHRWIELDLKYINEQTLVTDLVILLKTIPAVISGKGAY